jgi:hypothetical protein
MAKYYVESGQVRVVFDATDATEAAVRAFQWSCDKQAEERGWQLDDQIRVSELGFGRDDVLVLDTLDVVAIWQGSLFPWVG